MQLARSWAQQLFLGRSSCFLFFFFFSKEKSWKTLSLFNVPTGNEKFFKKCKGEIVFPAAEAEIRGGLCCASSDAVAGKKNRNRKSLHVLDVSWMKWWSLYLYVSVLTELIYLDPMICDCEVHIVNFVHCCMSGPGHTCQNRFLNSLWFSWMNEG